MVSESCPLTIQQDSIGPGRKLCNCDTSKCNAGALTANPPTKKCIRGITDESNCETPEDCGEGGVCNRVW